MDQMGKMMSSGMGSMMRPMMDKMISAMSPTERTTFVTTMMPQCLSMVLEGLDQPGRERLAREMIDSFTRLAEQYLAPQDGAAEGRGPAGSSAPGGSSAETEEHSG